MNEIVYQKGYEEYRAELGAELASASESFVRIGYLLKVARDTDILKYSEHTTYVDFAKTEFGLDKTQVSRFIRINDRFSEGGNSMELKEEYKGFGTRKLGVMLTLPEEITEELSPEYTVEDIETIQKEVKEEQKITPLEDYIEKVENENNPSTKIAKDDILSGALYEIGKNYPETLKDLFDKDIKEALSPIADQMYIVRIPGIGKLMIICKETEIHIINARTNEKAIRTWSEVSDAWQQLGSDGEFCSTAEEFYEKLYGEPFPKKEEVAPVQLEKKETPKPKVDNKKVKTPEKPKPVKKEEPKVEAKEDVEEELKAEMVPEEIKEEHEEVEKLDEESVEVIHPEEKPVFDDEEFITAYNEWLKANDKYILNVRKRDRSDILTNIHISIARAEKMRAMLLHTEYTEE